MNVRRNGWKLKKKGKRVKEKRQEEIVKYLHLVDGETKTDQEPLLKRWKKTRIFPNLLVTHV